VVYDGRGGGPARRAARASTDPAEVRTMTPTYRVRFSAKPSGTRHAREDVQTIDVRTDLDHLLEQLPAGSYVMYIEDLAAGQDVHWTRWPKAYRPGFGG
jgi:hypothetical protein